MLVEFVDSEDSMEQEVQFYNDTLTVTMERYYHIKLAFFKHLAVFRSWDSQSAMRS